MNDSDVDVGEVGVFPIGNAHAHFVRSGHFGGIGIDDPDQTLSLVQVEFPVLVARDDRVSD